MYRANSFVPNIPFIAGLGGEDVTGEHIDRAIEMIIGQTGKTERHQTIWLNRKDMGI